MTRRVALKVRHEHAINTIGTKLRMMSALANFFDSSKEMGYMERS